LREEAKAFRSQVKLIKDKKQKTSINKELSALNLKIKGHAKDAARLAAAKMHPDLADMFKLKKHDGRAEAVLIATYVKEKYR
jgi:hypothetical protein